MNRLKPLAREILAFSLALASAQLFAFLLVSPARKALYSRFWMDQPFITSSAWLLNTVAIIVVVEIVRTRWGSPWPIYRFSFRQAMIYAAGIPVVLTALALFAAQLSGSASALPHLGNFSEESFAELIVLLVGATQEEFLFRYFLLVSFARIFRSKLLSLLLVSTIFALIHRGQTTWALFAVGLWLGTVLLTSRSIWVAVICHYMLNISVRIIFDKSHLVSAPLLGKGAFATFELLMSIVLIFIALLSLYQISKHDALVLGLRRFVLRTLGNFGFARPAKEAV